MGTLLQAVPLPGVLALRTNVPRIRDQVLRRRARSGNDAPVANAGPAINLEGSASYDPEGDPGPFQWFQTAGPATSLSGANTARATFHAQEGQSYAFRLTVTDDKGASLVARVLVSTARALEAGIDEFTAPAQQIEAGQNPGTTRDEIKLDGSKSFHLHGLVIENSWRALRRQPIQMPGADMGDTNREDRTVTDSKGRFSQSTTKVFFGAY